MLAIKKVKAKKIIKRTALIILGALFLSPFVPFPINFSVPALEINLSDPYHVVEHTVTIRGRYRHNIFRQRSVFRGTIEISGHEQTINGRAQQLIYHRRYTVNAGFAINSLWYFEEEDIRFFGTSLFRELEWTATVYLRSFLRDIVIMVHDNGAHSSYSPLIVLRSTSREDAVERAIQALEFRYP